MATEWSAEATKTLIQIWGDASVQSQLDTVVRNKFLYQEVSRKLEDEGHVRSWQQCRTKIKNLTSKYRKVKYKNTQKTLQLLFSVRLEYTRLMGKMVIHVATACCQVKDSNRVSGAARATCPFYEQMDAILGS